MAVVFLHGEVTGANFRETLPWQYGILSAGTYKTIWDRTLPSDASGQVTVRITYIGIIDEVTTKETTFTITDVTGDPVEVGSSVCSGCHAGVAEDLQDSAHGFIDCESCHGPGSIHVSSPSKATIIVDTSASLCGRCHTRGDSQNRVEAEEGLIKRNQQFDELLSGGKAAFKCVRCHNPHISIALDNQNAIKTDCSSCHLETINQFHISAGVDCIDCHMPNAVKKETTTGSGDNLKGDGRSHIFTINPTARPSEMFYQEGEKTFTNGFLTLNFTCLGCHDGSFGKEHNFDWALQAATLIHAD
jgi:predicted CXXCH cytochrome family protein